MTRSKFEDILQNLHFSDNTKDDKSDKGCKMRSLINHFNQSFSNSVSSDDYQSIDEYMVKFKGRSSMKQYVKKKSQSNGILSFHTTFLVKGYLYQFDLHSGKKESREENMGPSVVLIITESLQNSHSVVFLIISSTAPHLLWSVMIEICMVFAIPKRIGKECRRCLLTERWRQVIFSTCIPKRYLSVSGLTGAQ